MATNLYASALWQAAAEGDGATVARYLAKGQDVNACDENGRTALHVASTSETVDLLLTGGSDLAATTRQGDTPLHTAVRAGRSNVVTSLLARGASANQLTQPQGDAPLHLAVILGFVHVMRALLDGGADCDIRNYLQVATPLHLAAISRKSPEVVEEMVTLLLSCAAEVNATNRDYDTPLLMAVRQDQNVNVVRHLIEAGAIPDHINVRGERALELAVRVGNEELVAVLLDAGADVNAAGVANGETPLHLAAQRGFTNLAQLLHSHGAQLDSATIGGLTKPLHYAVLRGSSPMVSLLLTLGADVESANRKGERPLHLAVDSGNVEIARELLKGGASVDTADELDRSPLRVALYDRKLDFVELMSGLSEVVGIEDEVASYLKSSATSSNLNINADNHKLFVNAADQNELESTIEEEFDYDDEFPLHRAVRLGQAEVILQLLLDGAPGNTQDKRGQTPLHLAASVSNEQIVSLLLHAGVTVDCSDASGKTPLHLSIIRGHEQITRILLTGGASIATRTPHGGRALHLAAEYQQLHLLPILQAHGAHEPTLAMLPLLTAWGALRNKHVSFKGATWENHLRVSAKHGWTPLVGFLIAQGVDVDSKDSKGRSALHLATQKLQTEVIEFLLDRNATIGLALHVASRLGHTAIVRLLLRHGADMEAEDDNGWLPLHFAAHFGHVEAARHLVASGARLNRISRGEPQFGPLHSAAYNGHLDVLEVLLCHGADTDFANGVWGDTALHLAAARGNTKVVVRLLAAGASKTALNVSGRTALQVALLHENDDIVRILTENGVVMTPIKEELNMDSDLVKKCDSFNGSETTTDEASTETEKKMN